MFYFLQNNFCDTGELSVYEVKRKVEQDLLSMMNSKHY